MYRKHFQADPLCKPDKTLSTCGSTEMPLNGMVHLPVTYESETVKSFPFRVTETRWRLLGIDLFNRLGFTVHGMALPFSQLTLLLLFPRCSTGLGKSQRLYTAPKSTQKLTMCHQVYVVFYTRCVLKCRANWNVYKTIVWSNQSTHHIGFHIVLLHDGNQVKYDCVWIWKLWMRPSFRTNIHCQHSRNCPPSVATRQCTPSWTWDVVVSKSPRLKTESTRQQSSRTRESSSTVRCRMDLVQHLAEK